jgi:hypothetical protein
MIRSSAINARGRAVVGQCVARVIGHFPGKWPILVALDWTRDEGLPRRTVEA